MCTIIVEAVKLIGEGEYNLNALKEIKVTESYLGLDQDVKWGTAVQLYNQTVPWYISRGVWVSASQHKTLA